jgi:hypothetical protein
VSTPNADVRPIRPEPEGSTPLSTQGEQQQARDTFQFADQTFVDQLARNASDGIALCRQRYRHNYPPLPRSGMHFEGVTPNGYLIRRVECLDCGCGIQVQRWEAYTVGTGRDQDIRVRPHSTVTEYQENEQGETYPTLGHGMVRPRDFRDAIASSALDDGEAQEWVAAALRQQRKAAQQRRGRR